MLKLVQLEIKKYKLLTYWKGILIANICIIAMLGMIFIIETMESNVPFKSFDEVMMMSDSFIRATFLVFSSVIMVKIIINEFKNNVVSTMFTYPISRKKILFSKVFIVVVFTFITIMFSSLLIGFGVYLLNPLVHIVPETISGEMFLAYLKTSFFGALASAGLSLIPLFFGIRKKSPSATIITAVILASLTGTSFDAFTLYQLIAIPISLGLIGILIGYLTVKNIEHVDI